MKRFNVAAGIAGLLIFAFIFALRPDAPDAYSPFTVFVLLMLFTSALFLPTIIAFVRGHHQRWAIAILNAAFGWTIVGWVVALIWANTATIREMHAAIGASK